MQETNEISITPIDSPAKSSVVRAQDKQELIVSTLGWSENDSKQPLSSVHMLHWSYCRMTNHLLDPTRESFKCPLCDYKSPRKGHVERHILIHSGEKPYSCAECSYRSHTKDAMTLHSRVHSGHKKFECSRCSYTTNRKVYLERHNNLHDNNLLPSCSACLASKREEATEERQALQTAAGKENQITSDIKTDDKIEDFMGDCTCQFSSLPEKAAVRKVKIYPDERPYPCSQCSYRAAKKSLLDKHVKVHTGERPFPCPLCKYRASRKAHLLRHLRTCRRNCSEGT